MDICDRCGRRLDPVEGVCAHCEQQAIHASAEVIPPGAADAERPARQRDSFAVALALAIAADVLQLVFFPLFAEGALSPLNDALDIAVGFAMVRLLGWHWAFLPSFLGELIPIFDELPCWTLAVLFVRAERAKLQSA